MISHHGGIVSTMTRSVILRRTRDRNGSRYLAASIVADGDIHVEGQDLGPGVTAYWGEGVTEYEWTWTIPIAEVPHLLSSLDEPVDADPLAALARHFSGERAAGLKRFLDEHQIRHEVWSRQGD